MLRNKVEPNKALSHLVLTNRIWFSMVCTLIDNDVSSQWSQCCGLMRHSRESPQQMTRIIVDKSADHA